MLFRVLCRCRRFREEVKGEGLNDWFGKGRERQARSIEFPGTEVGPSSTEKDACTILFRVRIAGMGRLLIGQFSPAGCI